jgi:N-terminal region of glycosyl transferase group 7/N-terminal domain of galactosyltransferase
VQFLTSLVRGRQISDFHIYIIEQSDDGRKFNRGKLLNIGFDLARKRNRRTRHDAFIFHDVDLLPQPDLADAYARFPHVPYHIARVWDRYSNNPKYFGGVVSFSSSDFKRINGYPNTFWGWYVGCDLVLTIVPADVAAARACVRVSLLLLLVCVCLPTMDT